MIFHCHEALLVQSLLLRTEVSQLSITVMSFSNCTCMLLGVIRERGLKRDRITTQSTSDLMAQILLRVLSWSNPSQ